MSKEMKRVTTATGNPVKLIVCPKVEMSFGGELAEPGSEVEVFGVREIAQLGTEPDVNAFCWMALYKSAQGSPQYIVSKDGDWWEANSKEQAEEESGAQGIREAYARSQEELAAKEKRQELAKGEVPTTLDEANAKIAELQAKVDAKGTDTPAAEGGIERAALIRLAVPNVPEEEYTKNGVPSTEALESLTGLKSITAEERDVAWQDYAGE